MLDEEQEHLVSFKISMGVAEERTEKRLLDSNATIVEDGGEPINVHRTPEDIIVLPIEHFIYPGETQTGGPFRDSVPRKPDIEALLSGAEVKQGP